MAGMSNFLEGSLGDLLFRNTAYAVPATYVALYTADPTDADAGTEVSGGSYARILVNNDGVTSPFWKVGVDGLYDNDGLITFPTATAAWGTITHVALRDALTLGNLLTHGILDVAKIVGIGDTFQFADGALNQTLA